MNKRECFLAVVGGFLSLASKKIDNFSQSTAAST